MIILSSVQRGLSSVQLQPLDFMISLTSYYDVYSEKVPQYHFPASSTVVMCVVSYRTNFKWCEFNPRDVPQLFGTPFSNVSLR